MVVLTLKVVRGAVCFTDTEDSISENHMDVVQGLSSIRNDLEKPCHSFQKKDKRSRME